MNALTALFTRRDPADVAAEAVHKAMLTLPRYAEIALKCERLDSDAQRARLLASVDDETRAQAVAFSQEPKALRERNRRLAWMRENPEVRVAALLTYYSKHIPEFIAENGMTHDPRLADKVLPFELFPRQVQMVDAMLAAYRNHEPLSIVKSRDSGASWCAMALLVSLALFEDGFTAIVGSQFEIKVDMSGTTGTLFHKIRMFLEYLPEEFRGGWTLERGSANMRVKFPNGSTIQGEVGDSIGRGGRASVVCLDEYAWLEHPDIVDAALAATSDVIWYISTPHGSDNPFAKRVRDGSVKVFMYSWRDDPRKTEAWAAKKIAADGQRKFDQEFGCSFNVGTDDQMFAQAHLDALTDAHVKLKIEPNGRRFGGFDPGGGGDASAFAIAEGPVVTHIEQWASSPNLKKELRRAFEIADRFGISEFNADCCGIGNGLESVAEELNAERAERKQQPITLHAFKASESPLRPDYPCVPGSTTKAKDYYPNKKSQAYDLNRFRARETYQMTQGETGDPENILSFSSQIPVETRNKCMLEFASITCSETLGGKLSVDKYGTTGESPNLADAVTLATAPRNLPLDFSNPEIMAICGTPSDGNPWLRGY